MRRGRWRRHGWRRGRWRRRHGPHAHWHGPRWWTVQPLTELGVGQQAEVIDIMSARASRLTRLSTLGLVPGCRVKLHQRRPAYVVQVGETEVTLDADIAREILVRRE